MSTSKHTPGPFVILRPKTAGGRGLHIMTSDGLAVGFVRDNGSQTEPNAALWRAAPLMLEALRACTEHMEWSTPQGKAAYEQALSALTAAQPKL